MRGLTNIFVICCLLVFSQCSQKKNDRPPENHRSTVGEVGLTTLGGTVSHRNTFQSQTQRPEQTTGAARALEFLSNARAYPNKDIPPSGIAPGFQQTKNQRNELRLTKSTNDAQFEPWQAMGPHNVGGRTLALAINPQNVNTIYAGSASGGLWRSFSGGKGAAAWQYVNTGFPALGVSSIAFAPGDSNIIYIGTGEMYGNPVSHPGILGERLNRGSYGIGILKSIDGGKTWATSLDWTYDQGRAVQMIRINPKRPETVWAATTIGLMRSYDAGQSWQLAYDVAMATDLVIHAEDTATIVVGYGGMGSPGHGVYRTTNSGATWSKTNLPQVPTFNGKVRLAICESQPDIIYASIGRNSGTVFNRTDGTWLLKTRDAGETWQVVSTADYSSLQGWYSHDVAVHPNNPDTVWAAGQSSMPYFSDNGGGNLATASTFGKLKTHKETARLNLYSLHADYHNIVISKINPQVIYFANDGGLFLSEDGGATIRNCNRGYQTTQFYNGSSSSQTDSLFALGGLQDNGSVKYNGNLFWESVSWGDGGWSAVDQTNNKTYWTSWQWLNLLQNGRSITGPPTNLATTNFIAPFILSPADNTTLYAGSNYVFKKSWKDASSWQRLNEGQPLGDNPAIAMAGSYQNANKIYVVTSPGSKTRGNVYKTDDGGDTWQLITGNLPDRFMTDIAVDPSDDQSLLISIGGFGSSHLFQSYDGGETWEDIGGGLPDVPAWSVVFDPDFPTQVFAGNDIGVYYSQDAGQQWAPYMEELPDAIIAMDLTVSWSNRMLRVATHGNGFYESKMPTPDIAAIEFSDKATPLTIALHQNYPNPFNPQTTIRFFLENTGKAELTIFNLKGQLVKRFLLSRAIGWNQITWMGDDQQGRQAASGIYIYKLTSGGDVKAKKMMLLR